MSSDMRVCDVEVINTISKLRDIAYLTEQFSETALSLQQSQKQISIGAKGLCFFNEKLKETHLNRSTKSSEFIESVRKQNVEDAKLIEEMQRWVMTTSL